MKRSKTEARPWQPQGEVRGIELLFAWAVFALVILAAGRLVGGTSAEACQPDLDQAVATLTATPFERLPAGATTEDVVEAGCRFERQVVVVDNTPHPGMKLIHLTASNEAGMVETVLYRASGDSGAGRF